VGGPSEPPPSLDTAPSEPRYSADAYLEDRLGGLNLTFEGLRGRDYVVLNAARDSGVPVAIVLAGGYARETDDTAAIHAATIAEAARLARA